MEYHDVTIAIQGYMFKKHPHFTTVVKHRVGLLMGAQFNIELIYAEGAHNIIHYYYKIPNNLRDWSSQLDFD